MAFTFSLKRNISQKNINAAIKLQLAVFLVALTSIMSAHPPGFLSMPPEGTESWRECLNSIVHFLCLTPSWQSNIFFWIYRYMKAAKTEWRQCSYKSHFLVCYKWDYNKEPDRWVSEWKCDRCLAALILQQRTLTLRAVHYYQ